MAWRLALPVAAVFASALLGCSGDVCDTCVEGDGGSAGAGSDAGGGGGSCAGTTGELRGTVVLFAPSGQAGSEPAENALVQLSQAPGETPIVAMADASGAYSVELPAGAWMVGGESADGYCTSSAPKSADVEACGSTELEVVLDSCVL